MDKLVDLLTFQGRANRAWYFWHVVLDDFAILTIIILIAVFGVTAPGALAPLVVVPLLGVLAALFWAGVAITVKRLHDLDRPAWHFLLLGIPLYNVYLGLVLIFKKGTEGRNEYGADPLAAARQSGYLEEPTF